jgi:hypothetical protein
MNNNQYTLNSEYSRSNSFFFNLLKVNFFLKTDFYQKLNQNKIQTMLCGSSILFRKQIGLFQSFEIKTKISWYFSFHKYSVIKTGFILFINFILEITNMLLRISLVFFVFISRNGVFKKREINFL